MRFLIVFTAVLGYAAAGLVSPYLLGANHGDLQAAAIDATVLATDHARAVGEGQARAAEAAVQWNTEAVRQTAEANRDIHENSYWNSVAAGQNLVAAAQTQAAALDGAAAAARGAHLGIAHHGLAPLGLGPYGAGLGPYGAGLGLGPYGAGLGVHGLGLHGWH